MTLLEKIIKRKGNETLPFERQKYFKLKLVKSGITMPAFFVNLLKICETCRVGFSFSFLSP
jgi:hypothetical protein